ncbi:MAG: glycosyltransferase [Ginsengibacter sp.]
MKILFAGKFEPAYNRTKVILDGLNLFKDVEVLFYNFYDKSKFNFKKLAIACKEADVVYMPSFTHLDLPFIKISSKTPIIFDPLISRYLTKVFDYKTVGRYSPRALKNFLKDKISMSMSDVVLCDTHAHKNYYQSVIGIPGNKLKILPVGVNTSESFPHSFLNTTGKFVVGFYGSFVPLQGTKIIIEVARLLKDHPVHFEIIGDGFQYKEVKNLALNSYKLTNINFTGRLKYEEMLERINSFDISLGIFGETPKADLVIPNKIYHYASLQKAIITKDTTAIKEIFENNRDIILCDKPQDIAEKILLLKDNSSFKEFIAKNCYEKITKEYNHKEIAGKLLTIAEELLAQKKNN